MYTIHKDGSSFDFHRRDSLGYHYKNSRLLFESLVFAPEIWSQESREKLSLSVNFIRPYWFNEKVHMEFANTKSDMDLYRRKNRLKEFQVKEWKPGPDWKVFLRHSSLFLPKTKEWTAKVEFAGSETIQKHIAILHGVNKAEP